jgi:hypothetical protein
MFWLCLMNGAAGHTYGANGIWQCNRPGQPHGASPHGGSYGKIPWDEAMSLPGSRQVGLGKKLLERYPWQRFQPHPEWVGASGESPLSLDNCQWIWFPEGNPAQDAPAAKRYYRRTFVLPEGKTVERARLRVSADDAFAARLNGTMIGTGEDWRVGRQFNGLAPLLRRGTNVLAIMAANKPTDLPANPAGLIACLEIGFAGGDLLKIFSDATWRCAKGDVIGWDTAGFDDAGWVKALAIGHYGQRPWGQIVPTTGEAYGPQASGIPEVVRVIYVPQSEPIAVRNLGPDTAYSGMYFDPVSGVLTKLGAVQADAAGVWKCQPPAAINHDWVLVLEAKVSGDEPL